MSNHWGGELLNEALNLMEAHGFFEKQDPEKVRQQLADLVNWQFSGTTATLTKFWTKSDLASAFAFIA